MKGNVEFASGMCAHCNARRKLERPSAIWGMGDFIMILFTCGLWLVPKLALRAKFRCTECGTAVRPS